MGFLDNAGLSYFWGKVTSALTGKQNTITAGDGLSKEGDTLSVTTPVRGVVTQAEFDALPEERQNKGLYVIPDGGEGGGGSGSAYEIYSTEETRIGTWIDGKPLYRKVFQVTTTSSSGGLGTVIPGSVVSNMRIKRMDGFLYSSRYPDQAAGPINFSAKVATVSTFFWTGNIVMFVDGQQFINSPAEIILEYTKTTD